MFTLLGRVCYSRVVFYLSASGGSARWVYCADSGTLAMIPCFLPSNSHIPVFTLYSLRCVSGLFVDMLSSFVTSVICLLILIFVFLYHVCVSSLTFPVPTPHPHPLPLPPFFLSSVLFRSNLPLYLMKGTFLFRLYCCTQLLVGLCKEMIRRAWRDV